MNYQMDELLSFCKAYAILFGTWMQSDEKRNEEARAVLEQLIKDAAYELRLR